MAIYSPAWLVEAAHEVMGSIDLDPSSCLVANAVVNAKKFYTVEDDGLSQTWSGNVYLNPPFEDMSFWLNKLRTEKAVRQAIIVGSLSITGYGVFQWFWENCLIFIPHERIRFWHPFRSGSRPRCFVTYLGPRRKRFIDVFGRYGTILAKVPLA